jgi:hypothetical protein
MGKGFSLREMATGEHQLFLSAPGDRNPRSWKERIRWAKRALIGIVTGYLWMKVFVLGLGIIFQVWELIHQATAEMGEVEKEVQDRTRGGW